jgi:predicted metal-binding membrane protein
MGFVHGLYWLGCCAVLMGLLFVGGVMNLIWIAGLTVFVAIEKLAPFGAAAAKVMAEALIAGGAVLVLAGW